MIPNWLYIYESKSFIWSSRINFIPFRIFRGPLFHKPVTSQELYFAVSYSKPALRSYCQIYILCIEPSKAHSTQKERSLKIMHTVVRWWKTAWIDFQENNDENVIDHPFYSSAHCVFNRGHEGSTSSCFNSDFCAFQWEELGFSIIIPAGQRQPIETNYVVKAKVGMSPS